VVVKKRLHKNLSVSDAIEAIIAKTLELAEELMPALTTIGRILQGLWI
jgi:hypothetical protein